MDNQTKPDHYRKGTGDLLKDGMPVFMTKEEYRGFCKGNVVKYATRYDTKNGLVDLEKAKEYLNVLIDFESSKENVKAEDNAVDKFMTGTFRQATQLNGTKILYYIINRPGTAALQLIEGAFTLIEGNVSLENSTAALGSDILNFFEELYKIFDKEVKTGILSFWYDTLNKTIDGKLSNDSYICYSTHTRNFYFTKLVGNGGITPSNLREASPAQEQMFKREWAIAYLLGTLPDQPNHPDESEPEEAKIKLESGIYVSGTSHITKIIDKPDVFAIQYRTDIRKLRKLSTPSGLAIYGKASVDEQRYLLHQLEEYYNKENNGVYNYYSNDLGVHRVDVSNNMALHYITSGADAGNFLSGSYLKHFHGKSKYNKEYIGTVLADRKDIQKYKIAWAESMIALNGRK